MNLQNAGMIFVHLNILTGSSALAMGLMRMLLSISKSLTASQKKNIQNFSRSTRIGNNFIASSECYFIVTGCFVREKGLNLVPKHFIISNEIRAQTFIEVFLNLPKKRDTVISLCFVCLSRLDSLGFNFKNLFRNLDLTIMLWKDHCS